MTREEENAGPTRTLNTGSRGDHDLVRSFHLAVVEGVDVGKRYTSTRERAIVGTHGSADLILEDPTVSRFHLELSIEDNRVVLRDLGSRNGSRVSGVEVGVAYLDEPAVISIGQSQLQFELGSQDVKLPLSQRSSFGLLVGKSSAMRRMFHRLERAAQTDVTVLLQGETGTGKDLAAESIHREGARRTEPFVVVDCGAVSPSLIESELFGHVRGAFTGADRGRPGAFELASGGTIFLDEIGELDVELQPKLLRVLESRTIQRVGGDTRIPVDVRVIAATNRSLHEQVNARRFRSDLYYRLAVLEVELPALRERTEDLPLLAERLLETLGASAQAAAQLRSPRFLSSLAGHRWPGNVRELRNYLERCAALEEAAPLGTEGGGGEEPGQPPPVDPGVPLKVGRDRVIRWYEHRYLEALLAAHEGNVSAAARGAGIDRAHLYRLLLRCGLR